MAALFTLFCAATAVAARRSGFDAHPTASGMGQKNPGAIAPEECSPPGLPMGIAHGGGAEIRGPENFDEASLRDWMVAMKDMRRKCQAALNFTGAAFKVPELLWTQTAYISPQMHPYDRFFFDPALGNGTGGAGYTVDKWLGDLNKRYGGIDKALIWPTYTNIGIDDRNTFELIRSMPGGVDALKIVVEQLHDRGVKVLWPYHPWDHSTHGQEKNNVTDYLNMALLQRDTGADGFNGDTMGHIPKGFYDASVEIYKPIAMEPEGGLAVAYDLNYMTLGWAEGWKADEANVTKDIVDVDKAKWLTDGKAMHNFCNRWKGDPANTPIVPTAGLNMTAITSELQYAHFNGLGYETWENVWGTWNGLTERAGESIRRVATLLRYFGSRGFLQSSEWAPHSVEFLQMSNAVFGSAFPQTETGEIVYMLINRDSAGAASEGPQVAPAHQWASNAKLSWYDCYHGLPLKLNSAGQLSFQIDPFGFGCVVGTTNTTTTTTTTITADDTANARGHRSMHSKLRTETAVQPADMQTLLSTMAAYTSTPLASFDDTWRYLNQTMVDATATTTVRPLHNASKAEIYVSGDSFRFIAAAVELEGKLNSGVDVQFPGETYPHRAHDINMYVGAMYVDKHPVTNAEYASYLTASHYYPRDSGNWLKSNFDDTNTAPKKGWEDKPVTYVSMEDARQYCAFNNKRLPHAYEWQYFAQGTDNRLYPWGNTDNAEFTPAVNNNWTNPGPEAVGSHPEGASPFGVEDLVRSVWQYTSEFYDDHTRSVILRGGSNYSPNREKDCRWITNNDGTVRTDAPSCFEAANAYVVPGSYDKETGKPLKHPMGGSHWYFPPAFELNTYNKYFLMSGTYERAGTIGFRCVADAVDDCGTNGYLCDRTSTPPATLTLSDVGLSDDWVIFSPESSHNLGNVTKKQQQQQQQQEEGDGGSDSRSSSSSSSSGTLRIQAVFSLGSKAPQVMASGGGATSISWSGGSGPSEGTGATSAAAFYGTDAGFMLSATAPPAGHSATLSLYLGTLAGAIGNLTAAVATGGTYTQATKTTVVSSKAAVVALTYKGGPLTVKYSVGAGGGRCNVPSGPAGTPFHCTSPFTALETPCSLSEPAQNLIDWVHWGNPLYAPVGKTWGTDRMKAGSGVLKPRLLDVHGTDLQPHQYNSSAAVFSWTGGTPLSATAGLESGVFSGAKGTFTMTVPADGNNARRLTLYLGVFNTKGKLSVTGYAPDGRAATPTTSEHASVGSANVVVSIEFVGEITVAWHDEEEVGNVTWQAAVLEKLAAVLESGLTLEAAVLLQA